MGYNQVLASFGDLYDVASKDIIKKKNHVPSKTELIDHEPNIVFSDISEHELVFVFSNGFVMYQTDEITNMTRSTVFPLKGTLEIASELEEMSTNMVRQMPSAIVLSTVGKNRIQENVERNLPVSGNELDYELMRSDFDLENHVIDQISQEELKDLFTKAIPTLTKLQARVLDFRYCYNYSQEQTGKVMGKKRPNVQKIEEGALKKLRKFFESEGYKL